MNQIQPSDQYAPMTELRGPRAARRPRPARRLVRFLARHGLVLAVVALPTLATAFYALVIASPVYSSNSSYLVRKPNARSWSVFSKILQTAGLAGTQDDAHVVHEFISSRDAVSILDRTFNLRAHYGGPLADPLAAFPGPFGRDTQEDLYRYMAGRIDVLFDPSAGVTKLTVRSFDPAFSQRMNAVLLNASEDLVNRLNDRWRTDSLRFAQEEVDTRQRALEAAQTRITAFRNEALFVDPRQLTDELGKAVTNLAWSLAQARARLRALAPEQSEGPQAAAIRRTIASLEQQIVEERGKIAGDKNAIARSIADYERLFLEQEFAEKALLAAMGSLENAKQYARRQQLYLERIVSPGLADYPSHPKPVRLIVIALVLSSCVFLLARFALREFETHGSA